MHVFIHGKKVVIPPATLRNMTDEQVLSLLSNSDDPIIGHLCARLRRAASNVIGDYEKDSHLAPINIQGRS